MEEIKKLKKERGRVKEKGREKCWNKREELHGLTGMIF